MSDEARATPAWAGPILDEERRPDRVDALLDVATDGRRRTALAALRDRGSLSVDDLAAHVAADGRSPDAADEDERRRAATALHHSHLPRLEDAGLVELDRRDDDVVVRPRRLDEGPLGSVLDLAERDRGEDAICLLADRTRRRVLRTVLSTGRTIDLDDLAASVAARDGPEPDDEALRSVRVALHHVHLPRLEDSGVVEYDPAERRVAPGRSSEALLDGLAG